MVLTVIQRLHFRSLASACLFLVFVLSGTILNGQSKSDTALAVKPEAIPLIKISDRSQATRTTVSRAQARVLSDDQLLEFDSLSQIWLNQYVEERERYLDFRSVTPNKLKLNNEIRKWRTLGDARVRWSSDIDAFMNRAAIAKDMLVFEQETWNLTREAAVDQQAPASVIESIDNTQRLIGDALDNVNDQIDRALELAVRVVSQRGEIDVIIADLENWSVTGELSTFYKRHRAIWNIEWNLWDKSSRSHLTSFSGHMLTLRAYWMDFQPQAMGFLIISLILIIGMYFLRGKLRSTELDDSDEDLVKVRNLIARHTWVSALYFCLVLAIFYLGNLPIFAMEFIALLTLLLSFFLLAPFTAKGFKWLVVFIMIAFVMDSLKSYVWFSASGYRLYLYLQAAYAFGVIWKFTGAKFSELEVRPTTFNKIFIFAGRATVLLLVVIVGANTLGYTNLADTLLRIITVGAVITVLSNGVLYIVGGVIGTALSLYFQTHSTFARQTSEAIRRKTLILIRWFAVILWVIFILVSAELYRPFFTALDLWLTAPWVFGTVQITPGSVISFSLVIIIAFAITRSISFAVENNLLKFLKIKPGVLYAASMVVRYIIVAFAIAIGLGSLGIDLSKFGLIAGALGVGIGFGLQNIVSNFIAGMILTFEQPVAPGDTIEINGIIGVTQKIGVRASIIRSFDGADVVIPNNTLLSNDLINWTRVDHQKRVEVKIGAAYGSDPVRVRQILMEVARNHPKVNNMPAPMALFSAFGSSSLDFRLLFWAPVDDWLTIQSDVQTAVYEQFHAEGIQIPFPRQDVTILTDSKGKEDDSNAKESPPEDDVRD